MEGMQEGLPPEYHLDPSKVDTVEKLLEKQDPDDLFDELMGELEKNPDDKEVLRQANLLVNRLSDLIRSRQGNIQH